MRQTDKREWLQVQISSDLKHALRVKAAQDRESMTTAVEAAVELYVSGQLDKLMQKDETTVDAVA